MSTSLQLSKGDNFTEDAKLIPNEQECTGFKVDLLAMKMIPVMMNAK